MLIRRKNLKAAVLLSALILTAVISVSAQSSDQDLPTPVHAYEISGAIPALDLGDPRLTRHFYAFNGTHGDLLITVESKNLNGDVDVFTSVTFKPLVKIPMYAQASSSLTTKSIYVRSEEILILRVEARTPNDDPGQYRVRFGGAFAAFSGGIPVQEEQEASAPEPIRISSGRTTRRVSSVGARIEGSAATPTPQPTPVSEEPPAEAAKTDAATTGPEGAKSTKSSKNRATAGRAPRERKPPKSKTSDAAKNESAKTTPTETTPPKTDATENEEKPTEVKPAVTEPEKKPEQDVIPATPPPGAHLIIEEKDGTRIDRPMSTVSRVIVANGIIIVYLKNGKIEKLALADVARMTIEQQ